MSYTPTEWKSGDVVTSAKLNKMEQGIADGGSDIFVVTLTSTYDDSTDTTTYSADKTFAEIDAAFRAGKAVWLRLIFTDDESYVGWFPPAESNSNGVSIQGYDWKKVSFNFRDSQEAMLSLDEYSLSSQGDWTQTDGEYSVSPHS